MFLTPPKKSTAVADEQLEKLIEAVRAAGLFNELLSKVQSVGPAGARGDAGRDGIDGKDGADGKDGVHGKDGRDGVDGKDGVRGEQGERGLRGSRGQKGDKGSAGSDGLNAPTDATFLTYEDERDSLGKSLKLEAGPGISLDRTAEGRFRISSFAGGAGGVAGQPGEFSGISYEVQEDQERYWTNDELIRGYNIIGVRYAGAAVVYLPHDMDIEKLVSVKNEYGSSVSIRSY